MGLDKGRRTVGMDTEKIKNNGNASLTSVSMTAGIGSTWGVTHEAQYPASNAKMPKL